MNEHYDLVLSKAAIIERCVMRAREEYSANPAEFAKNFTRQDAAILNIQRACEAALDMGQIILRHYKLGYAQSSRDVFAILEQQQWITPECSKIMKNMVGYRNIAVHAYQQIQLPITIAILQHHLQDLLTFSTQIISHLQA